MKKGFVLAWWSAGITSAVACKIALELYDNVKVIYIGISSAHPDNLRFKKDCERWYGCEIVEAKSKEFVDQFDVIESTGFVNSPYGAPCTKKLKKQVRFDIENSYKINLYNSEFIQSQVWGYEFEKKEINRAIRHGQQYPHTTPIFPLIEKGLTKNNCASILERNNIDLPAMYHLGYSNNNCIGCVKGGKGYWNKIRLDFPEKFNRMKQLEREVGSSCINGKFLDELKPSEGRMSKEILPNCGSICELKFSDIPHKDLSEIIAGKKSIYDAIGLHQNKTIEENTLFKN